ncbi:LysM domain protein [Stachybotrys elegans]|uniref:LysM domain protein n=1 Tax=Stachybotrys elegans TaxID=80388 RepID=A0A8K0T041_9HYPO|nr:LysM domain protein [Stachybotrys elegans]
MREINKARVENPRFNKNKLSDNGPVNAAPPLGEQNRSRAVEARSSSPEELASPYSVPSEIKEAAMLLAESIDQSPQGNHSLVAAAMVEKYRKTTSDTNDPEPLQAPYGKLGGWAPHAEQQPLEERAAGYWMVNMAKRGMSPYAQSGYKVWRNVKDYGAKGDGRTDDTAAINKAISDGGRCGATCGSSTIRPATVYFPPGTYLVSSSIIQFYNTEFLGDPLQVPTILAAKSFVGLGVMTSDVYLSDDSSWYINTNNFLRSIRNFKIDIRNTDPYAYICAIHWQARSTVAQASSLENIEFYMLYNTEVPHNTQQGIYMENGSGGFLSDLTFIGGNFGAYFGNQQFTTSGLLFVNSKTAVQVHWDWAWTMHGYIIEGCQVGIAIVNGVATGEGNTGQGVGSLILVDSLIANTPVGITTSPITKDSTSFLAQNVGFFNVRTAIQSQDAAGKNVKTVVQGGNEIILKSWGFGKVSDTASTGSASKETFVGGSNVPAPERSTSLLGDAYDGMEKSYFTRRRPKYYDIPESRIMDVKALGAKGDGRTDDTAVLNGILEGAANTSSIVYFPYGSYIVRDTLRVPSGSRIIGQAWPSLVARGPNFQDEENPRPLIQVGRPGDQGIVEIQSMMLTHSGPTAGAVMIEWNIEESSTGSAGLWDTHVRVGGAIGTEMLARHCPKKTGKIDPKCKGASMLMHMTPGSTGYLENVWLWVADHDLDITSQDQIDIYAARGLLVESKHAWLWGTSVEHCTFYQYQLSGAKNILLSMIQTESPYYQPVPAAPTPFTPGAFPDDPTFANCKTGQEKGCGSSWGLRIIDSSAIYMLGAGIYSWFYDYSQDCLKTENCQQRGIEVQSSKDIWIYNLCTKAIVEMISPAGKAPTMASNNKNGFLSSVLAWLQGSKNSVGDRAFEGFTIYNMTDIEEMSTKYPSACVTALTQRIECDDNVKSFSGYEYRGSFGDTAVTDSICDAGCGRSLEWWYGRVSTACRGYTLDDGALPTLRGGRMYAGYNETCLRAPQGDKYCNDIIAGYTSVDSYKDMPSSEMCSFCYVERNAMMARTPYSTYDEYYKERLEYIFSRCGEKGPTEIPEPVIPLPDDEDVCLSGKKHLTVEGETCDSIALKHSIASAALQMTNVDKISDCSDIEGGLELCLPLGCEKTHVVKEGEACIGIEVDLYGTGVRGGDIRLYNPWVYSDCSNLWDASESIYGHVICLSPQNGASNTTAGEGAVARPTRYNRQGWLPTTAPADANIPEGTTPRCSVWYTVRPSDIGRTSCAVICAAGGSTIDLLMDANKSLGSKTTECDGKIKGGMTYCARPAVGWEWEDPEDDEDEDELIG